MERLLRLGTAVERVNISSLALLKMLKHRSAVEPMNTMDRMLGEYVDEYTDRVTNAVTIPQFETGVSVERIEPLLQAKMKRLLKVLNERSSENNELQFDVGHLISNINCPLIVNCWEVPEEMEDIIMLARLDKLISHHVKLQKIIKKVGRKSLRNDGLRKIRCLLDLLMRTFGFFYVLNLGQEFVYGIPIDSNSSKCVREWDCLECIDEKCTYVELENKTSLCVENESSVKGLKRRQFTLNCPSDLVGKSVDGWLQSKLKFMENEAYGFKIYTIVSIPIMCFVLAWIIFRIWKYVYHRTKYPSRRSCRPRGDMLIPDCLRGGCHRASVAELNMMELDSNEDRETHFDCVSLISDVTTSLLERDWTSSDSSYHPSSNNSTDSVDSINEVTSNWNLRAREPRSYKE